MSDVVTVKGNIELLIGNGPDPISDTVPGVAFTVELVPPILAAIKGYRGITRETSPRAGAVAEWTAETEDFRPVTAILWAEPAFDETAYGRFLAAQRTDDEGAAATP